MNITLVSCIVIEDDEQTLDIFCELLENNGMNVLGRGKNDKDAGVTRVIYKPINQKIVKELIDKIFLENPFYASTK